jgi:hypothetical protein
MRITLRLPVELLNTMLTDLRRSHPFAYERVGFLYCKQSAVPSGQLLLAHKYRPVGDHQYIKDRTVGAKFDSSAIRDAMQFALSEALTAFHVHLHEHPGQPQMSPVDIREMQALMPCFVNLCPERVHGALLLSADAAMATVWGMRLQPHGAPVGKITSVGSRIHFLSRV